MSIGAREIQAAVAAGRHPLAIEDALHDLLANVLVAHDVVLLDDMHLVTMVLEGCHSYPRGHYLNVAITALATRAEQTGLRDGEALHGWYDADDKHACARATVGGGTFARWETLTCRPSGARRLVAVPPD